MKKKVFSIILALTLCVSYTVTAIAIDWDSLDEWSYEKFEDGRYVYADWGSFGNDNTSPALSVTLESDSTIYNYYDHYDTANYGIHAEPGTRLIIEFQQGIDDEYSYLLSGFVKIGYSDGTIHKGVEEDGFTYEYFDFEYTTHLEYDKNKGGLISGSNKMVYMLDKPGYYSIDTYLDILTRGSNAAPAPGMPTPVIVRATRQETDQPSSWAVDAIRAGIAAEILHPRFLSNYQSPITRAEFCALAVALYENVKGEITGRSSFTDTNDVNVQKAAAIGVVSGVGDNKFAPDQKLTREQAATMLSRLADAIGKPLTKLAATFADNAQISTWAADAV